MAKSKDYLPGMEPKKHKKIHDAACLYAELRNARMEALRQEVDQRERLAGMMRDANMTEYEFDDVHVEFITRQKIKVKISSADDHDELEEVGATNGHAEE